MINVKLEEIIYALDDDSYDINYYLDLCTGEVIEIFANDLVDQIEKTMPENFQYNKNKYLKITDNRLSILHVIVRSFILQIENQIIRNKFITVFEKHEKYRVFKKLLLNYPRLRKYWKEFYDLKMQEIAAKWLYNHKIIAEIF